MGSKLAKRKRLRRRKIARRRPEQEAAGLGSGHGAAPTPLYLSRRQTGDRSAGLLQRQSLDEEEQVAQRKRRAPSATPVYLQRICAECEEEEQRPAQPGPLQAKKTGADGTGASRIANTVAAPGAGKALPGQVRNKIEPVLGHDLRDVRVHDDGTARGAADKLNARAFTHQNHIYLGAGESEGDLPLMAHEATHVLQQQGGLDLLQNKHQPGAGPAAYLQRQPDAGVADGASPDAGVADADTAPRDAGVELPAGVPDTPYVPTGPNACPTAEEEQKKNRFRNRFFSVDRFRPSAGYGIFDATYLPRVSLMTVVSKMKFSFLMARNTPDPFTLINMLARGQDISIFFWTEAQKQQYKRDFVRRVAQRWSFQHVLRSKKPCWPFVALPYVTPQIVDNDGDAHYQVKVYRDQGSSGFRARNPGTAGWQGTGELTSQDVQEDPDFASQTVARSERQRLERAIATAGASPLQFAQGSPVPDGASKTRLKNLADLLKLKNPSDPAIPIILHGYASSEGRPRKNAKLAHKRAINVAALLRAQGVPQPIVVTSHGAVGAPFDARNRRVEIKPSRTFETTYSANRFSAAEHEFGHAIGLPDEYTNYAAGTNLGDKQQAFIDLANKAGVAPPDRWGDYTSSQMSAGVDVLPRHYLTIWEALGAMTDEYIKRDEWKID